MFYVDNWNFTTVIITYCRLMQCGKDTVSLNHLFLIRLGGLSLCSYSTKRQSNIFIGCQPHGRISLTGRKPTTQLRALSATVAQPLELLPRYLGTGFFPMFVPISACAVARNYPISVLAERATPIPHSLSVWSGADSPLATTRYLRIWASTSVLSYLALAVFYV